MCSFPEENGIINFSTNSCASNLEAPSSYLISHINGIMSQTVLPYSSPLSSEIVVQTFAGHQVVSVDRGK